MGRKDTQVKIHGQRIELGEIESHLCRRMQEAIQKLGLCSHRVLAAVDVSKQPKGESRLAAFLHVCSMEEAIAESPSEICGLSRLLGVTVDDVSFYERLKQQLCHDLATYMVPSDFFTLTALPKSTSGKLDRRTLQAIAQTHSAAAVLSNTITAYTTIAPLFTDPIERRLRVLWNELLEVDEESIGPDSNFFHLGGDSISAMRLAAAAIKQGLQLPVLKIMRYPELSRMAAQINHDMTEFTHQTGLEHHRALTNGSQHGISATTATSHEFSATNFQTAMLQFNMGHERGFMNYFVLRLTPRLNRDKFEMAWRTLLTRHAVLRSCFDRRGDRLFQRILPDLEGVEIKHHKVTAQEDLDAFTVRIIESDRAAPLHWGDCLTKLFILQQDETGASRVIIRLSHALYDGMCLPVLWEDLSNAYSGKELGPSNDSFAQFAKYATNVAQEAVEFWRSLLGSSQMTTVAHGPHINTGLVSPSSIMEGRVSRVLPSISFVMPLVTPASVLKAAWAVVLAGISNSNDVIFGHIVSCRETLPLCKHDTFGAFLNCIPVRVRLEAQTSATQLTQLVHEQHVASLPYHAVGLQQLVELECVDWPVDVRFLSVVQYQNLPSSRAAGLLKISSGPLAGTDVSVIGSSGAYSDLWIVATPGGEVTEVDVVFDKAVVSPELANSILDKLCAVIQKFHCNVEMGVL